MTFGAVFASILAVLTASAGAARAAPPEVDAAPAPATAAELPSLAAGADAPSYPQPDAGDAALSEPAPPNALAEAARVAIAAAEAGTPIVVAPAPDAEGGASGGEGEPQPEIAPAPAGPPLSDASPILLDRVEEPDGWATERLIEPSGEIVVHTVNAAGTVQVCNPVGSLLSLAIVEQRPAAGGEYVHVARDTSGALVTYAIGTDGEPRAVRLLAPAPR